MEKKAVIFCSASYEIDPKYNEAARAVVDGLCRKGYTIVSGGTVKGTMGVVGDAVLACGGRHIGVLPQFMDSLVYPGLSQTVWTDTMSDRKEKMRQDTCAAISLPGGIGTLDEMMETFTLAKLCKYPGKVIALNIDGFYEPLKTLLDHYVSTGMLDEVSRGMISFPDTVGQLLDELD